MTADMRASEVSAGRKLWTWLNQRAVGYHMQRALAWAPAGFQKRVRQRSWALKARDGVPLTDVTEIGPQFRRALAHLGRDGRTDVGDYLEFGVYAGTSFICMHNTLNDRGLKQVRLFGFDSFEGLPDGATTDDDGLWQPGAFKAEYEVVSDRIAAAGASAPRGTLIKGWFSDTLKPDTAEQLGIRKAGVIMVDADMYTSSKQALDFCAPLIRDEAVVLFDDWYAMDGRLVAEQMGQKRAFDEFMVENPGLTARDGGTYRVFGRLAGHIWYVARAAWLFVLWLIAKDKTVAVETLPLLIARRRMTRG